MTSKSRLAFAFIGLIAIVAALITGHHRPVPRDTVDPHRAAETHGEPAAPREVVHDDAAISQAFARHERDVVVEGEGTVSRVLADDREGSRHQRFILRLASGQTVLVAHNIDIARRIEGIEKGDRVAFRGEYVWNAAGGVVHWTHVDPAGRHPAGWIKHNGETYQ